MAIVCQRSVCRAPEDGHRAADTASSLDASGRLPSAGVEQWMATLNDCCRPTGPTSTGNALTYLLRVLVFAVVECTAATQRVRRVRSCLYSIAPVIAASRVQSLTSHVQ